MGRYTDISSFVLIAEKGSFASASFGRRHVAPHALAFRQRYPDLALSFNFTDSVVDLVRHNCLAFNLQGGQHRGWTFVRDGKPFAVRVRGDLACNDGELVTVLDEFALSAYDIQAVYPQQRYLPAKVRYFIDDLKHRYQQAGYWES